MNTLVLIAGRKRSGKNTLVDNLMEGHEDKFNKLSFADPIKESLALSCGINKINLTLFDFQGHETNRDIPLELSDQELTNIITTAVEINEPAASYKIPKELYEERSIRSLMRVLGTGIFVNQIDPLYWINKLEGNLNNEKINIIDDLRQKTEYYWALNKNAVIIKTIRDDINHLYDYVEEFVDQMVVNHIVQGTLEQTKNQAKNLKELLWNLN